MLFSTPDLTLAIPISIGLVYLFIMVCRWFVFKKMNVHPFWSLMPVIREYKIFRKCWKVWPFVVLLAMAFAFAFFVRITGYIDFNLPIPAFIKSNMRVLSMVCLIAIHVLKCKRLAFAFGHDIGYMIGLLFLPPLTWGLLAFSDKNTYKENRVKLEGQELKEYIKSRRTLVNRVLGTVTAMAIIFCAVGYIGHVMMKEQQPAFLIKNKLNEIYDATSGKISGQGEVIYPARDASTDNVNAVRDLYYPDKSNVAETTVYMYIIGSNLEDSTGSASINLAQIRDATAAGSKLKFIVEAGGTNRWFTDGFKRGATARYMIKDGNIEMLEQLPRDTCMSRPDTLKDFLNWANQNYPSDRKMLFFWDHGAGLSGFGLDILNSREDRSILSMDEIAEALEASGSKYDVIAFDACLMQTMEIGLCLQPYADYLLASEESEASSGMYYTAAFSRLAKDPTLETIDFGAMMCSSYDQSLEQIEGSEQPGMTMSMTDLRYMPAVSKTFIGYLHRLDGQFKSDRSSFINMSTARSKSYEFDMEDQIDLIDFITFSDISPAEKNDMISKVNKSIAVRNAGSANHINGLACYMPYDDLASYTNVNATMKKLRMTSETKVYNDFASILGSQRAKKGKSNYVDVTKETWYVKSFENYDASLYLQDVSLTKKGDAYKINLTDNQWETITGYEQGLKMKVGNKYADLGSDNVFDLDENGHYMLEFNDTWVAINGVIVALHPGTPKDMGGGEIIYSGTVDATLNFVTPITIYIQWVDEGDVEGEGVVLGYLPADEDSDDVDENGMPRGFKQFKANNIVTFLYDWYDKSGNYLSTAVGHLPISVGTYGLRVTQKDISSEEYYYYGILKDVMNREIETETLHHNPE